MIIHINGYPGVGKLTIGRIVAEQLGGRLLDNHSV
jgi:shikimate kinase